MARSVVGLDIGHGVLRAAEVANPAKPRPTLLRYHEMSVPIEAVNRGEVTDPALVAQALKVMWSRAKFSTKDVVLGMGNQRVLSRDYSVRAQPLDRIRES
ncbi:MAG TPA: pilus assembly protein PilM, partial [Pseudolysinimonas sp.]